MELEKKLSVELGDLARESQSLIAHIDMHGLPTLQRNIAQLDSFSRGLARGRGTGVDHDTESKATSFFAQVGLNAAKHSATVRKIDMRKVYEPMEAISDMDVESFLEHQHKLLITTAIAESSNLTSESFRRHYLNKMEDDWERSKPDVLEAVGSRPSTDYFGHHGGDMDMTDAGNTSAWGGHAPVSHYGSNNNIGAKEKYYARALQAVNRSGQGEVVTKFMSTANEFSEWEGHHHSDIIDSWELLRRMVEGGDFVAATERQFENAYLANDQALRWQLIEGAKSYAEWMYMEHVRAVISDSPNLASHESRGNPSTRSQIRAFLLVNYSRSSGSKKRMWFDRLEINQRTDYPIWAEVFYCWRCGERSVAVEAAREGHAPVVASCLEMLANSSDVVPNLPSELLKDLVQEYNRSDVGRSSDPFKVAIYNLITRCEDSPNIDGELIYPFTEDYIWYHLSMLEKGHRAAAAASSALGVGGRSSHDASALSLEGLQDEITRLGANYFDPDDRNPLKFFNVLIMTQQFEQAVSFLSRCDSFRVEAVHFAIALDYYGLLRKSSTFSSTGVNQMRFLSTHGGVASSDDDGAISVDFARIIKKYVEVSAFHASDPVIAFHYFLRLQSVSADIMREEVRDLILSSREYERLIGEFQGGRVAQVGCLFQYLSEDEARLIIADAARVSSINGNHTDAIDLYILAGKLDHAASELLDRLSRVAALTPSPMRQQIQARAVEFMQHQSGFKATFEKLLCLVQYFDLYHAGPKRYKDAIHVLETLALIPFTAQPAELEFKLKAFHKLDKNIQRLLPDAAHSCMDMLYALYSDIKRNLFSRRGGPGGYSHEQTREKMLVVYREKARALVSFVGMIQVAHNVNAELVRKEALMS